MEKEYIIEFEAEGTDNNCIQGIFDDKTVIDEVKDQLKSMYGDRLNWYVISENSVNGVEEIFDSRKYA